MQKEVIIVWIPNGFDPNNPSETDMLSREALTCATWSYRRHVQEGNRVLFLLITSVVKSADGRILSDVMFKEAQNAGVYLLDIFPSNVETTGSPTDGLAIATFSREHPDAALELYACMRETADYFLVMYRAVAEYVIGYILPPLDMKTLGGTGAGLKSKLLYRALRAVTKVARMTRPTFMLWYNFLNWAYTRRVTRGFDRTIK